MCVYMYHLHVSLLFHLELEIIDFQGCILLGMKSHMDISTFEYIAAAGVLTFDQTMRTVISFDRRFRIPVLCGG